MINKATSFIINNGYGNVTVAGRGDITLNPSQIKSLVDRHLSLENLKYEFLKLKEELSELEKIKDGNPT